MRGKQLDGHFGQCRSFSVFVLDPGGYRWLEHRAAPEPLAGETDEERIARKLSVIDDCELLFVSRMGLGAVENALARGIMVLQQEAGAEVIPLAEGLVRLLRGDPPLWLKKALDRARLRENRRTAAANSEE